MKRIKVSVTVGDRKITLDGPEDFVRTEVERLSGFQTGASHAAGNVAINVPNATPPRVSERQFVQEKSPTGHAETIAVLAYCLRESGVSEFTADDVRRAYIRAGVRPPKVMAQTLRDAKKHQDFIESGEKRGTFRLSPHGERTVLFDLPEK